MLTHQFLILRNILFKQLFYIQSGKCRKVCKKLIHCCCILLFSFGTIEESRININPTLHVISSKPLQVLLLIHIRSDCHTLFVNCVYHHMLCSNNIPYRVEMRNSLTGMKERDVSISHYDKIKQMNAVV